jgi:hypothetical protein
MIDQVASVTTLPPADDRLYGPDTFGAIWLLAAIAAVALAVAGLTWAAWPGRRVRIAHEPAATLGLRQRYLRHIDELEQKVVAHELAPRALHHELSRTLRRFAVELGTHGATSMSSGALDDAGQRAVAAAVRRFEHPQFEADPRGDPLVALGAARAVVTDTEPATSDAAVRAR